MPFRPSDDASESPREARPPASPASSAPGGGGPRTPAGGAGLSGGATPVGAGAQLEGYEIREEIHRGGQGVVYRAVQLGTKREVGLKVLLEGPFASETTRRRFEREIELAASLRHPHIVTILESGVSLGRYYFAMEFIRGLRLDRYLAQNRPPVARTLALFETVCQAVNFAHQRGVIHRDLKPPNILVDDDGQPHILDFGLAKPTSRVTGGESTIQVLSMSGQLIGTVAYMSPEQAAGLHDVDVRSDVYSIGVMLYEALVGRPPYSIEGPLGEVLSRIAKEDATHPRALVSRLPDGARFDDDLATILLKCLEKEPARRYQSAGDLARDLQHYLRGEPIEAKRASTWYMVRKTVRRYRFQAATAALILVMLIGFLITFAGLFARERDARERADQFAADARASAETTEAALQEARQRTLEARAAAQQARIALTRERIQRGDLALQRGDLQAARDSFWDALDAAGGPAARWALRRFYQQTNSAAERRVALDSVGPVDLSPDGARAALCAARDGIAVYQVADGQLERWLPVAGPVIRLDVAADGAVAASGATWLHVWPPQAVRPEVSLELRETDIDRLHVIDAGRRALLISGQQVQLVRGAPGQIEHELALRGGATTDSAYSAELQLLAATTSAGLELVRVGADKLWRMPAAADDTRTFHALALDASGRLLAAAPDALHVRSVRAQVEGPRAEWTRWSETTVRWTLLDLWGDARRGVAATDDGRFLVFSPEGRVGPLRLVAEDLQAVRQRRTERGFTALDADGALITWSGADSLEQQRAVLDMPRARCVASADGSVALAADERGRVLLYAPQLNANWRLLLRPRVGGRLPGMADRADIDLALSGDGRRALVRDGASLRWYDLAGGGVAAEVWSDARVSSVTDVALSDDGARGAWLARSPPGDLDRVVIADWPPPGARGERVVAGARRTTDFVGAAVRGLAFIPRSRDLLVARSNGQLVRLADDGERPVVASAWITLDAPPVALAVSRDGALAAVACADRVLRIVSLAERRVLHQLEQGGETVALSFNPRDDVLLVRLADHRIRLFDPTTGELVSEWTTPTASGPPAAAWLGVRDALLLGYDGRVHEYRFEAADAVIERNRAARLQRRISQAVARGELDGAWSLVDRLADVSVSDAAAARLDVLAAALRRPTASVPSAWLDVVAAEAPAATLLRLGHAAYDGGRFTLAGTWLRRALDVMHGDADAITCRRVAESEYLAGAYSAAAERFGALLARPDLDPALAPTIKLQRLAALTLGERASEARQAAAALAEPDAWGRPGDALAGAAARIISRVLTAAEDESWAARGLDDMLTRFDPRALLYKDDLPFYAGELARQRGDLEQAAVQYQRCIDLSQDVWPANWARYRLETLPNPRPAAPPRAERGAQGQS